MDRFEQLQTVLSQSGNSRNILFHGSQSPLKALKPKDSGYRGRHVFATNRYSFALAYAGNQWNDFEINQSRVNGKMILTEIEPGKIMDIFNRSGYVHIVPGESFRQISGSEFISDNVVNVLESRHVSNVLKELQSMQDVEIMFYPHLPPFIKSREAYIRELEERYGVKHSALRD